MLFRNGWEGDKLLARPHVRRAVLNLEHTFAGSRAACSLLMLLIAIAAWEGPADGSVEDGKEATVTIAGVVVLAGTADGVPGALVRLQETGSSGDDVICDAQGRFSFSGLQPATYRLTAFKVGLASARAGLVNSGHVVTVAPGKVPPKVVLELQRTGTIAGRISDLQGDPIRGLTVFAFPIDVKSLDDPGGERARLWVTDDTGSFRIFGLPPGEYVIAAAWAEDIVDYLGILPRSGVEPTRGYGMTYYPGTFFRSEAVPVRVDGGAEARVEFTTWEVEPVSVTVQVDGGATEKWTAHITDNGTPQEIEEGHVFEFQRIFPGEYELNIGDRASNFLRYTTVLKVLEGEPQKITVSPTTISTASVTGHVHSTYFQVLPDGLRVKFRDLCSGETTSAFVDQETGQFTAQPPTGKYEIYFAVDGADAQAAAVAVDGTDMTAAEVELENANVIEARVEPGNAVARSITGTVRERSSDSAGNIGVLAVRKTPNRTCKPEYYTAVTDQNGLFRITGIVLGKYDVYAFRALPQARLAERPDWLDRFADRTVRVDAGKVREYRVELPVIEERP